MALDISLILVEVNMDFCVTYAQKYWVKIQLE